MHPRSCLCNGTYNDPVGKFDHDLRIFDIDVQIAGLSIPFVLPDDYTLTVGNTYVRPLQFRDDYKQLHTQIPLVHLYLK